MTTKLKGAIKREVEGVDGILYIVTLTATDIKVTEKGCRKGYSVSMDTLTAAATAARKL